eukprot:UN04015
MGLEMKLFEKHNIDLTFEIIYGGPEVVQTIKDKNFDFGEIGLLPFTIAFGESKGTLPAKVVGTTFIQKLDHYLVTAKGVENNFHKINRVGILTKGSCDSYLLNHMLDKENVNINNIKTIPLNNLYGKPEPLMNRMVDASF